MTDVSPSLAANLVACGATGLLLIGTGIVLVVANSIKARVAG
jgi:hypothetical protein